MNRLILALAACCSLAACDNGNAGKGRTEEGQRKDRGRTIAERPCRGIVSPWPKAVRHMYGDRNENT